MKSAGYYIFVLVLAAVFLVPVFWIVSVSLRLPVFAFNADQWIPHPITFYSYFEGIQKYVPDLAKYIFNTARIAILGTVGQVLSCTLAGYALARFKFPGRNILLFVLLATLMVPAQTTLVPLFVMFRTVGLANTPWPIIIPAFAGNAVGTFMFRQFFLGIPRELDEAAIVDGAGPYRIFWSIILPLAGPAIASWTVISFSFFWNGFFLATFYLQSQDQWVLTQVLRTLVYGRTDSQWTIIMAIVVLMSAPMVLLYAFTQRYFQQGLAFTAFK
jgi:multiple sugar transport system permease protein